MEMEDSGEPPVKKSKLENSNLLEPSEVPEADFTEDVEVDDKFSAENKYNNFVDPEEMEKLREFQVLDEVRSNDEDSNDDESESSDGKSEVPEDEIEKMLEEDLPEDFKGVPKPKAKPYITRQKVVLEEKGVNQFEVLPLDWMMVRHYSGMPVYMHRATRVCTLSKPYFLGKGNTRRHDIPISAIPCLAYRKALEEEEKQKEIDKHIEEQIKSGAWQQNLDKNKSDSQISSITTVNKSDFNDKVEHSSDNKEVQFKVENSSENIENKCPFSRSKKNKNKEITDNHDQISQKNNEVANKAASNTTDSEPIESTDNDSISENQDCESLINNISKSLNEETNHVSEINHNSDLENPIDNEVKIDILSNNSYASKNSVEKAEIKDGIDGIDNVIEIKINEIKSVITASQDITLETNQTTDPGTNETRTNGTPNDTNVTSVVTNESQTEESTRTITEAEETQADETSERGPPQEIPLNRQPVVLPGGVVMPPPRVETVSTSWKAQHLNHEQINDYCKKLFKFKTVNIMHFKCWADRRKYNKARKTLMQYPTLPHGTKLITIPASSQPTDEAGGKAAKRDWVMNMNGRSYLSVFHEYVRRALQKQPVYEFKQLENAATPYQATVFIGGIQYGVGHGSSKRSAKSAAARASIHILIPEMRAELDQQPDSAGEPDFSFFDYVGIEDPRITEFCAATCEPSPHAILRTCLLRNFGAGDKHIHTEMKKLEYQKIELTMKVGKHSATVVCKNKKTAKQRASQAILQALHPHVRSWGSLLRLYGSRSVKSCKEKKLEEQQITLLQDAARHNEPNHAVLQKLRHEMRKLRERDEAVVPIGTLLVKDDLPTHSGSNLNNVDL